MQNGGSNSPTPWEGGESLPKSVTSPPLFSTVLWLPHAGFFLSCAGRFLQDLEGRLAESLQISDVCDIVEEFAQQRFSVYIDYVRNQLFQEKTYSSLM